MVAAGNRRRAREAALQMLYQAEVSGQVHAEVVGSFWESHPRASASVREYAERLTTGAFERRREIDALMVAKNVNHERGMSTRVDHGDPCRVPPAASD